MSGPSKRLMDNVATDRQLTALETAVREYLNEIDNPVPDAIMRLRRDTLRKLVGIPKPVIALMLVLAFS